MTIAADGRVNCCGLTSVEIAVAIEPASRRHITRPDDGTHESRAHVPPKLYVCCPYKPQLLLLIHPGIRSITFAIQYTRYATASSIFLAADFRGNCRVAEDCRDNCRGWPCKLLWFNVRGNCHGICPGLPWLAMVGTTEFAMDRTCLL